MKVFIVYREDGYGSYSVIKLFSLYDSAIRYIETQEPYERGFLSIEEDFVE